MSFCGRRRQPAASMLKDALRNGREPTLPESASPEARIAAIRETWAVYEASTAALVDFLRVAFATIRERADEWTSDLDADVAKAKRSARRRGDSSPRPTWRRRRPSGCATGSAGT